MPRLAEWSAEMRVGCWGDRSAEKSDALWAAVTVYVTAGKKAGRTAEHLADSTADCWVEQWGASRGRESVERTAALRVAKTAVTKVETTAEHSAGWKAERRAC